MASNVPEPDYALAERLFEVLADKTRDTKGVTRAAYGDGEQFAHDLVTAEAHKVGLPTSVDAGGNLYIGLPGSNPNGRKYENQLLPSARTAITVTSLDLMRKRVTEITEEVGRRHGVQIELGPLTGSTPAVTNRELLDVFGAAMDKIGVPRCEMACGAGDDAAVFAGAGVPTLMLFVRNEHGRHNPDEAMDMADFAVVTRLLANGLTLIS